MPTVFLIDNANNISIMITNIVSMIEMGDIMPRTGLSKEEIIEKYISTNCQMLEEYELLSARNIYNKKILF